MRKMFTHAEMKQANAMFQYAEMWKGEPVLAAAPAKKIRDAMDKSWTT